MTRGPRGLSRNRGTRNLNREELESLMSEEDKDSDSGDDGERECEHRSGRRSESSRDSQGSFSSGFETAVETQSYCEGSEASSNRSSVSLECALGGIDSCASVEPENESKHRAADKTKRYSTDSIGNGSTLRPACSSDSVYVDIRHLFTLPQSSAENQSADEQYIETICELESEDSSSTPQVPRQVDTPDDLDGDACRICHCGNEAGLLISPCLCMGTVRYVHHSCMMDWLQRCVKTKCELCLYPVAIRRTTKPLKKWRLPSQKPTPIIWLLTFVIALTLNVASIAKDGSQQCVSNPCIIFYVVGALGAMLGFAFFYHWLLKSIRYVQKWFALNEEWNLIGPENLRKLGNANLAVSKQSLMHPPTRRNGTRSAESSTSESSTSECSTSGVSSQDGSSSGGSASDCSSQEGCGSGVSSPGCCSSEFSEGDESVQYNDASVSDTKDTSIEIKQDIKGKENVTRKEVCVSNESNSQSDVSSEKDSADVEIKQGEQEQDNAGENIPGVIEVQIV